jgi:hypothetical protein
LSSRKKRDRTRDDLGNYLQAKASMFNVELEKQKIELERQKQQYEMEKYRMEMAFKERELTLREEREKGLFQLMWRKMLGENPPHEGPDNPPVAHESPVKSPSPRKSPNKSPHKSPRKLPASSSPRKKAD